jgi:hypothetical protein
VSRTRCGILHAAPQSRDPAYWKESWTPAWQRITPRRCGALRSIRGTPNSAHYPRPKKSNPVVGTPLRRISHGVDMPKPETSPCHFTTARHLTKFTVNVICTPKLVPVTGYGIPWHPISGALLMKIPRKVPRLIEVTLRVDPRWLVHVAGPDNRAKASV